MAFEGSSALAPDCVKKNVPVQISGDAVISSNIPAMIKYTPRNSERLVELMVKNFEVFASQLEDGDELIEKLKSMSPDDIKCMSMYKFDKIVSKLRGNDTACEDFDNSQEA